MSSRIISLDMARGLTVLVMPAVHTVMLYSHPEVHHSWLGIVLTFFAEGPGAQLFMFLMGFSPAIGKQKTIVYVLKRSVSLFVAGYVLNLFRMVLPYLAGTLPPALVNQYLAYPERPAALSLLLTGDILQMAGISLLMLYTIYRTKQRFLLACAGFMMVIFIAPASWDLRFTNIITDHLSGLFFAGDNRAFFPLFPWLCYPLAGLAIADFMSDMQVLKRGTLFKYLVGIGIGLVIAGFFLHVFQPSSWDRDFYRSGPARSLYQTGFLMIWLSIFELIAKWISRPGFTGLLTFCSRHITSIYVSQWLIISWGIAWSGYQQLNIYETVAALLLTTTLSLAIPWLLTLLPITSNRQKTQKSLICTPTT